MFFSSAWCLFSNGVDFFCDIQNNTGGDLNLSELYADKDYVYAEVVFNDPGVCKEDFTIRTMIAEPNSDKYWAFIGCFLFLVCFKSVNHIKQLCGIVGG